MAISPCAQVQTTTADRNEASRIADALLSRRLAACVQIVGPIQSRYWWHGELESAEEWLCVAKTTSANVEAAMEIIVAAHSYETPEITVVAIVDGSEAYLRWIDAEVEGEQ